MSAPVVVIGGGIVGLAVAARLADRGEAVVVLEKESQLASHQSGRNSGVIHSGLYYAPGSLKATMAAAGARSMVAFARERGVAHDVCGKLVVAVDESERDGLRALVRRAEANDVPARLVDGVEAREYEPNVRCVEGLRVESTGIIDYRGVCEALADDVQRRGEIRLGTAFRGVARDGDGLQILTTDGEQKASALVNCGGLHADRIARACGLDPEAQIVPFRGEYFHLRRTDLVRGLIYPVPDPRFPFLGVHLTKGIDGRVHVGPNAVLALAREGYRWRHVDPQDLAGSLTYPGLWRLSARHLRTGAQEVRRSLSRRRFAESLSRLVPGITADDLERAPAGVRAQAVQRDGSLVDDFLIKEQRNQVHVINAPSPAATASLDIAAHVVARLD
ncbi:MAG TPA: L-2-hydroxyglutarate oxidase, partial [Marmoricola sp.]|nr:L-2-hydroxyglutarate oxidase [Marmoricola sp.]